MVLSKRILFVVNHAGFFVSHRLAIAKAAQARGYEVHVTAQADGKEAAILGAGLQFHPWEVTRASRGALTEARALRSLDEVVRQVQPSLMHLVTMKGMLYGGLVARARAVPNVVFAVSGLGYVFLHEGAGAALFRQALLLAFRAVMRRPEAHAIFQNDDDMRVFDTAGCLRSPTSFSMIRGSGVDLDAFPATSVPSASPSVFVLPARMLKDKGVEEYVEAARILRSRGVSATFVLAGGTDPNPASVPEASLRAWDNAGLVEWKGHCTDMPAMLRRAFAVVLPSYREGLPKALLEGAACGRPLIATDVPGCRDVVRHGQNGLLVPAKNAMALADAMHELIKNPAQAAAFGRQARRDAEAHFALPSIVAAHIAVYTRLLPLG